jgi:transposase
MMEDVLDVYHRPYDAKRPQVCLDETGKELRSTPRGKQPPKPAQEGKPATPAREDYEYERAGMSNMFLWVEPLTGRRGVTVTDQRTAYDFAEQLRLLAEEHYPEADKIVLVTDNLNTHTPACLYERFEPEQAHRIMSRIEWHYTPPHGSWLNMAECEISALTRQCLKRRIADKETLGREIRAWVEVRNRARVTIDWRFSTADARTKLKRLYPTIKPVLKLSKNEQPS